jgi:hypothetical protein
MWEFLGRLVEALPAWFLVVVVAALLAGAAWVLPRLRRDKSGKWYIYSRSYEHQKNRLKEQIRLVETQDKKFDEILGAIDSLGSRTKSVECENLKQTFFISNEAFPKKERLIAGLKYVYAGGNGLVREEVARFVRDNPGVYEEVLGEFPRWALPGEGKEGKR